MFLRNLTGFRSFSCKHGRISMGALEGSSNTNLREKNPRKLQPPLKHLIVTLDPNKFAEKKQKRFDIGDQQSFRPYISLRKQSSSVISRHIKYDWSRSLNTVTRKIPSYPSDTKAFLYYSIPAEKPRIAGELRLRVASSDEFASFESGSDLLLKTGQPWSRPLFSLSKYYSSLYEKLREEQLVPDDLDTVLSTLRSKKIHYHQSQLYTLNDTFIVNFSYYRFGCFIITEQGMEWLLFRGLFFDARERSIRTPIPYTGSALARLERSTLPEHKGTRTVVLRFLKIMTPVKCVIPYYDGHISWPKEGELHQTRRSGKNLSEWSVNIDKPKGVMIRGLRLLWDVV